MGDWIYWTAGIYFAIPVIAIFISGRTTSLWEWSMMVLLWPFLLLTMGPEELP